MPCPTTPCPLAHRTSQSHASNCSRTERRALDARRLCHQALCKHCTAAPQALSIWRISVTAGGPGSGAPRTRRHEPVSQRVFASHTHPAPGSSLRLRLLPVALGLAPAAHGERGQPCCRARPLPHGCEVLHSGICTHPELAGSRGAGNTARESPTRAFLSTAHLGACTLGSGRDGTFTPRGVGSQRLPKLRSSGALPVLATPAVRVHK